VRSRALCGTRIWRLEKCEEYLRRHPGRQRQGIVPDLQTGTALYELKGIRPDRIRSNCNGSQVTGVEKRGVKIPMEIQKLRARDNGCFCGSRRTTSFGPTDVFVGIICARTRQKRSLVANGFD
jgi:hypothetical protein